MAVDQRFGLLEHDGSTIFGGLVCCITAANDSRLHGGQHIGA